MENKNVPLKNGTLLIYFYLQLIAVIRRCLVVRVIAAEEQIAVVSSEQ